MDHDRLCRWDETSGSSEGVSKYPCDCAVIARVREDERARTLRDAAEAVRNMVIETVGNSAATVDQAVATIEEMDICNEHHAAV